MILASSDIYYKVSKLGYFRNKSRYLKITEIHLLVVKDKKTSLASQQFLLDYGTYIEWSPSIMKEIKTTIIIKRVDLQRTFSLKSTDALELYQILKGKVIFENINLFYLTGDVLGQGISSKVYKATQIITQNEVAIKIIKSSFYNGFHEKQQIIYNELKVLKSLDHPKIIKMQDVFFENGSYSIVFNLIKGQSIQQQIESNGLIYLDSQNIIHRDIKCSNLVFNDNISDELTILDFGLSVFSTEKNFIFPKCGTPGYVAPEILKLSEKTQTYSNKCDVFSAGVLFYKILIGRQLLSKGNFSMKDVYRITSTNLNSQKYRHFPQNALLLIEKMLHPQPLQRISAIDALQDDFFTEETSFYKIILQQRGQSILRRENDANNTLSDFEGVKIDEQIQKRITIPHLGNLHSKNQLDVSLFQMNSIQLINSQGSIDQKDYNTHDLEHIDFVISDRSIPQDEACYQFNSLLKVSYIDQVEKISFYCKDRDLGVRKLTKGKTKYETIIKTTHLSQFYTNKIIEIMKVDEIQQLE